MNKKIKNIASVVQTKSAAVLCTLCAVLFLASCVEDEMADGTHSQKQDLRTVSMNFNMPADRPSFGDGTASRAALDAQTAEILLGDSTLAVSRAEGGSQSRSESTSSAWENDDQILVKIDAGSTQARLTLQFFTPDAEPISDGEPQVATAGTWYLMKEISYVKYTSDDFTAYNAQGVTPMIAGDTSDDDKLAIDFTEELTLHLDWTASQPTVSIIYAPDMQWSLAQDNTVSMEQKNPATTATTAPELWTVGTNGWVTNQARLRVNTGDGNAGDVVTLTSSAFDSAWEAEPTGGIFTATTDAEGDAYFYGATTGNAALTSNFIVQLTQMRVPVPQPAPRASEGRSVALDDAKQNVIITLDTPITLLEASDVVPVTLAAETAYKLMADVKRTASAKANLSVIDGQCGITEVTEDFYVGTDAHVAAVKKQIETAVAMGITEFTVINELAVYNGNTVVGKAINEFGLRNSGTKISLTLADATEVIDGAFCECTALKSVSAPAATWIGQLAFGYCTALERVSAPYLKEIYNFAFNGCESLASVTMDEVTHIYSEAFMGCTALTTVNLNKVIRIGEYAFSELQLTDLEIGENAASDEHISLEPKAFSDCTLTGSVKFHKVVGYGSDVVDGLTQKNAFEGVTTSHLDLYLAADQPLDQITVEDGQLMWAGAAWKSITLLDGPNGTAGTKYYIDNGMPTVEIDGYLGGKTNTDYDADVDPMKNKIEVVATHANNNIPAKVIVKNGLAPYNGMTQTVVGEALSDGIVHLVLDDAITSIPEEAFVDRTPLVSVTTSATTIGVSAFNNCSSLTSVSLRATSATTIERSAFSQCHNLATVNLSANTAIGDYAFMTCTALTGMDWSKVTSIGVVAFANCTSLTGTLNLENVNSIGQGAFVSCSGLTGISSLGSVDTIESETFRNCSSLDGELNLPNVTSIGESSFSGCNFTEVTFGKVVTTYNNAFTGATVSNCDLELAAGQSGVTTENGNLMWAGAEWNSITIGNVPLTVVGNEIYAVIDGSLTDYQSVKNQVTTALAADIYNLYVANGLATYSNQGSAGSVVGEAIRICGAADGSISLVLDDRITAIPTGAFTNCKALNSVVAKKVATIGNGAFYECTNITAITFGTKIESCLESAFGQVNSDVRPWTMSCDLTLAQGQETSQELQVNWNVSLWAYYEWQTITVGTERWYPNDGPI